MLAVIETEVSRATGLASISKVAVVAPSGTVTIGFTKATPGSDDATLTTVPPTPAALSRVTVPTTPIPPVTRGWVTEISFSSFNVSRCILCPVGNFVDCVSKGN